MDASDPLTMAREYVHRQREHGRGDDSIRHRLAKQGWSEESLDRLWSTLPPPAPEIEWAPPAAGPEASSDVEFVHADPAASPGSAAAAEREEVAKRRRSMARRRTQAGRRQVRITLAWISAAIMVVGVVGLVLGSVGWLVATIVVTGLIWVIAEVTWAQTDFAERRNYYVGRGEVIAAPLDEIVACTNDHRFSLGEFFYEVEVAYVTTRRREVKSAQTGEVIMYENVPVTEYRTERHNGCPLCHTTSFRFERTQLQAFSPCSKCGYWYKDHSRCPLCNEQ